MKRELNILQYLGLASLIDGSEKTAYEIKKFLSYNQVQNWLPVDVESIFYSVQSLLSKGYLQETSHKKYTIHSTGKDYFLKIQRLLLSHFDKQFFTYKLAYKFCSHISLEELKIYTHGYKGELDELCNRAKHYRGEQTNSKEYMLLSHEILLLETEIAWIESLQDNNFYFLDSSDEDK